MKAIILCAGQGTRLRPYTDELPKCMVKVNGVSLIDIQLKILRSRGIHEIVLIGGHFHEKLPTGLLKVVNPKYDSSNMVKSLSMALEHVSGDVIIGYGDIAYSADILDSLINATHDINVSVDSRWEEYWRSRSSDYMSDVETLMLGSKGSIIDIGNKPRRSEQVEGQYMGIMKLNNAGSSIFRKFLSSQNQIVNKKSFDECYMTDMLQSLINQGTDIWPCFTTSPWIEVDTVDDLHNPVTLERAKSILTSQM